MSLTCHGEIGRVGRVGEGCYEETAPVEFRLNSLSRNFIAAVISILFRHVRHTRFPRDMLSASASRVGHYGAIQMLYYYYYYYYSDILVTFAPDCRSELPLGVLSPHDVMSLNRLLDQAILGSTTLYFFLNHCRFIPSLYTN